MSNAIVLLSLISLTACAKMASQVSSSPAAARENAAPRTFTDVIIVPIDDADAVPRFNDVKITGFSKDAEGGVRATVAWTGRGAGTFAMEGPTGTMIATGVILPNGGVWFRDVADAKAFSELMSRGLVFGEAEPEALKIVTLDWLNRVVAPKLDEYLRAPVAQP